MEALHLVLDGGVAGAQGAQVVDDLGLLVHLLLDQLGALLGVDAAVEHEGRQVVRVLAPQDDALLQAATAGNGAFVYSQNRYNICNQLIGLIK